MIKEIKSVISEILFIWSFMHHCHWFCLLYARETQSRLSAGSLGTRLGGSHVGENLLSQIAKMAERSFADRLVLPVTAAIYRNGEEKPAMRWSFEMGIGGESDKMLLYFIFPFREGFGIPDRFSQLNQQKHSGAQTSTRVIQQA